MLSSFETGGVYYTGKRVSSFAEILRRRIPTKNFHVAHELLIGRGGGILSANGKHTLICGRFRIFFYDCDLSVILIDVQI